MTDLATATMLAALILVASIVSVEFGISVAIIEIGLGVVGANLLGLRSTPWIDQVEATARRVGSQNPPIPHLVVWKLVSARTSASVKLPIPAAGFLRAAAK